MIDGSSVEAWLIGVSQFRDMANTWAFSPADTFSYFKRCLSNITLSDWLNVEVQPEDQYDSFDEAMVLWLDDCLPTSEGFSTWYDIKYSFDYRFRINASTLTSNNW